MSQIQVVGLDLAKQVFQVHAIAADGSVVAKLRQVDVLVSQAQSVADAIRSIGVTEVSYYRWRHGEQVFRRDVECGSSPLRHLSHGRPQRAVKFLAAEAGLQP
jgi:hypothetical protein